MYVPGAPERISPSVARTGARRAKSGLSVPSRAPDPYGAQSAIPAATTTVARMVKARPIAEGDLRYNMGLRGRREGSCRGRESTCDRAYSARCGRAAVRSRSPGRRLYHVVTRPYAQCSEMLTNAGRPVLAVFGKTKHRSSFTMRSRPAIRNTLFRAAERARAVVLLENRSPNQRIRRHRLATVLWSEAVEHHVTGAAPHVDERGLAVEVRSAEQPA